MRRPEYPDTSELPPLPRLASAVVLAAGLSGRMNTLKPMLPLDGVPAVVRATQTFTDIGVPPVVVLGHEARTLAPVLDELGIDHVTNADYRRGMYSSLQAGIRAIDPADGWLAVLPADIPLVRAETVGRLVRAAQAWSLRLGGGSAPPQPGADTSTPQVVYPVYHDERGHPPLLGSQVSRTVSDATPGGGLRELLAGFDETALDVPVEDAGVLLDLDEREDFETAAALAVAERLPSRADCLHLFQQWGTPAAVRAHGEAVASAALALARALNEAGACLNLTLLEAAALLHDVGRGRPEHARAGAERLAAAGLPRVAVVTARHMDLQRPLPSVPGEAELLYLSDKLVLDTVALPLERRLAEAGERFTGDERARQGARRRLQAAARIAESVECVTGKSVGRLLGLGEDEGSGGSA